MFCIFFLVSPKLHTSHRYWTLSSGTFSVHTYFTILPRSSSIIYMAQRCNLPFIFSFLQINSYCETKCKLLYSFVSNSNIFGLIIHKATVWLRFVQWFVKYYWFKIFAFTWFLACFLSLLIEVWIQNYMVSCIHGLRSESSSCLSIYKPRNSL